MATATAEKKSKKSTEVLDLKNMIGGKFVDSADGKTEDILNPATRPSRPRARRSRPGSTRRPPSDRRSC
jgi:hypothetical protein